MPQNPPGQTELRDNATLNDVGVTRPYLEFEYLQLREIVPVLLPKLILVTVLVPLDEILREVWRITERWRR